MYSKEQKVSNYIAWNPFHKFKWFKVENNLIWMEFWFAVFIWRKLRLRLIKCYQVFTNPAITTVQIPIKMTVALIDNISIILQVKTSQLDTCKRSKIQFSQQKYNFPRVTDGDWIDVAKSQNEWKRVPFMYRNKSSAIYTCIVALLCDVDKFTYYAKQMRKSTHLISYVPTVLP